jgi:hypothetical protein
MDAIHPLPEYRHPEYRQEDQSPCALTIPLLGSILVTGGAVYLCCTPPAQPSLTWPSVFFFAFLYLLIAACVHSFTIWSVCRLLRDYLTFPVIYLIAAIWVSTAWLPLMTVLARERSPWTSLVPPLISASAVLFLKRSNLGSALQLAIAGEPKLTPHLFHVEDPPPLLKTVLPAGAAAVAFELAILALVAHYPFRSGLLFAFSAALIASIYPLRAETSQNLRIPIRPLAADSFIVFLLLVMALIPYLQHSGFAHAIDDFIRHSLLPPAEVLPKSVLQRTSRASEYSGVVLVLPAKPHEKLIPPPPASQQHFSGAIAHPVIIPFDGVYWYFKPQDGHPRPDARRTQGDPAKVNIRSTDFLPLEMEAHQKLGTSVSLDCCSALRLVIRNADDRPGEIAVEILLKNARTKDSTTLSLGTQTLASSREGKATLNRAPVDELLRFPIPRSIHQKQFDEIVVVLKPAAERSRAGAHIAIQQFELVP